jgi:hypothetical protein
LSRDQGDRVSLWKKSPKMQPNIMLSNLMHNLNRGKK